MVGCLTEDGDEEEEEGELAFMQFLYGTIAVYFTYFESTVRYELFVETDIKTAAFGSFELFHLYRANGQVGAIPT